MWRLFIKILTSVCKSTPDIVVILDVKKILIVSHSPPGHELLFGEETDDIYTIPPLKLSLIKDLEGKVCTWIYGSYNKTVDVVLDEINYINNSYYKKNPYWAKRIEV